MDIAVEQAASVDESPCDAEPIQFLGCIQPHAFMLEISADWLIVRASANLAQFLPVGPDAAIGHAAGDLLGHHISHEIRGALQISLSENSVHRLFGLTIGDALFDVTVIRLRETTLVEGERQVGPGGNLAAAIQPLVMQLRQIKTTERLCAQVARQMRALCGFDRVMLYRFQPDGSGEVVAETKRADLPPFRGLRYPASDIPKQARLLYERNTIRLIADVKAVPVPVLPTLDPAGTPLDLSFASARAVSGLHIEYLQNMGVAASLSVSILVDGKLWGLLACHHRTPKLLPLSSRATIEFFGNIVSTVFEARLHSDAVARREAIRALHMTLLNAMASENATLHDAVPHLRTVQQLIQADGFTGFVDGRLFFSGTTPNERQTLDLLQFLNRAAVSRVYATHALSSVFPEAAAYADVASGVLAVPISRKPRDFVVFYRRELVKSITWAGDPAKAVTLTEPSQRLTPRKSFGAWRQTVRSQSAHWSGAECEIAEALRVTLIEVMLQITDRAEKQRKISHDQQDLLITELNHRVRNILNLIVGLVRQCSDGATSVSDLAHEISARIHALARAHDQLTSSGWGARSISNMIRVEAGAYLADRADRVTIHGRDAYVQPDAFATLALVVHELMTNAVKYGAFRDSSGSVEIELEQNDQGLTIVWRELNGGPVVEPKRRGFGSTIIERAIPHELSGTSQMRFEPEGLCARMTIPLAYIAESPATVEDAQSVAAPDAAPSELIEGVVLLVEDNLLIALETEDALYTLGASDVHIAATIEAALSHLRETVPDFAVLDYNLGREQSVPIAEQLERLDVPFVFATGYGNTAAIDPRFRQRPIIVKPYSARSLLEAFDAAIAYRKRMSIAE